MKKTYLQTMLLLAIGSTVVYSCKKKDDTAPTATTPTSTTSTTTSPSNPMPTKSDATGVCVAIQTVTYQEVPSIGTTEVSVGLGVAAFPTTAGAVTYRDAGTISLEQTTLEKQTNNSFVTKFTATPGAAVGITFSGKTDWKITGSNGVPAIDTAVSEVFPSSIAIKTKASASVSTASDFVLSTENSITNADSVIFSVYGPSGASVVTKAGSSNSNTFSASVMASVGKGMGFVQVTAYKIVGTKSKGSEKIYFINEKVNTISVKFE